MYKTIYVPVDNSDYSNQAINSGINLGREFGSRMIGCHVYAAQMHDYRFKQMEYTLPDEYLDETELHRQRKIHDSLITMGLKLISDSYLEQMKKQCELQELEFEPRMIDGKHHTELVRDMKEGGYDLTVLGALGIGRSRDSQIGSVCERVARDASNDVWVVKRLPEKDAVESDTILVGVDGSPQSFGALMTAIELAKRFGKRVEAIAVYDPYLHYSVFNSIVGVLTEKAAKVFRFEEQNQLHEEIIDTGLAQIYHSHLDVASKIAADQGVEISKVLLDGKAYQKILDHVRKTNPWLIALGRIGVHSAKDSPGLGSNTENLLRLCPCDVLLTTRIEYPELDVKAEESIRWSAEALERMKRVPDMVRGIAQTAIYRLAIEQGHSVITSDVLDDAMDRYMPKSAAQQTRRLAGAIAIERAQGGPVSVCKGCGLASSQPDPVKCGVCGSETFHEVTPDMLEKIAEIEGGLQEETTYDGRKLKWSQDAKRALWTLKDAYQRRRAKARVEKSARVRKLTVINLEFASQIVEEESGVPISLPSEVDPAAVEETPAAVEEGTLKLISRDAKNVPLFSAFDWTDEATARVLLVPAGFMRDRTQQRIEELAGEGRSTPIDMDLVEQGLDVGRRSMEELLSGQSPEPIAGDIVAAGPTEATAPENGDGKGKCPMNEAGSHSAILAKQKPDSPDSVH